MSFTTNLSTHLLIDSSSYRNLAPHSPASFPAYEDFPASSPSPHMACDLESGVMNRIESNFISHNPPGLKQTLPTSFPAAAPTLLPSGAPFFVNTSDQESLAIDRLIWAYFQAPMLPGDRSLSSIAFMQGKKIPSVWIYQFFSYLNKHFPEPLPNTFFPNSAYSNVLRIFEPILKILFSYRVDFFMSAPQNHLSEVELLDLKKSIQSSVTIAMRNLSFSDRLNCLVNNMAFCLNCVTQKGGSIAEAAGITFQIYKAIFENSEIKPSDRYDILASRVILDFLSQLAIIT